MEIISKNEELDNYLSSRSETITIVMFHANWCLGCIRAKEILIKSKKENFCFVHVDESIEIIEKYRISMIPCFLYFKGKTLLKKELGILTEDSMKKTLNNF